jgi:hypothetical protein
VRRLRPFNPALPCAAGLLLAACMVSQAQAQTALVNPDPLSPALETNPNKPPRFQKSTRSRRERADAPAAFTQLFAPPPSGAGSTGFDASNAPESARAAPSAKPAPGTNANAQARTPNSAQTPQAPSPYDQPQIPEEAQTAASDEANAAYAAAPPGMPPVPEIGPIRKRPPKRKAHTEPEDPYAQLGIRAGAFDLYPAVELLGGYDTNPGQAQDGKAAWLYTVKPELRVQSDWSRHELKADLRGSYTGYSPDETPGLSRPYFNGIVDGRIDVTRDTRIDLQGRGLLSTDNPGSPNLQAGLSKLPIYTTFGGSAGLGQRFNRLDLSIKGDVDRTVYQESHLTDGTTASNEDRNYDQYGGRLRAGYELSPGVVPFAEVSADTRKHDLNTDFSGYQRDSNGITGKAGTSFKLRGTLTGEIALGYTTRNYEDPRLSDIGGLIGEASLIWTASALTTAKLTGTSTVGESTVPGVSGVLYRDVGVQVDHAFRRWLIGTVKAGYGNDDYVGLSRDDNRYSLGIGLTYKLNRMLQIKGEIDQNWLRSNQPGNNYSETLFLLGIRLQR